MGKIRNVFIKQHKRGRLRHQGGDIYFITNEISAGYPLKYIIIESNTVIIIEEKKAFLRIAIISPIIYSPHYYFYLSKLLYLC